MPETILVSQFTIQVEQQDDFQFIVRFDKDQFAPLTRDEPEPLGKDSAPNATRIRISRVDVHLNPRTAAGDSEKAARCRTLFEDYCVVTQSVRERMDVHVTVEGDLA